MLFGLVALHVVRHELQLLNHLLLSCLKPLLRRFLINSSLVHMLDIVQLRPSRVNIGTSTQYHGNILHYPLSIVHDELVTERIRLYIPDQTLLVVRLVHFVHVSVVKFDPAINRELPQAHFFSTVVQHPL